MEQTKEAVYLINDDKYLHLRENGAGVGFATYNKVTGEPLESGQISEKNLPPDGRNAISAARNWYLFELSDDDRRAIQQESVKILENIPQAGIGRRRIWEPETLPKDIRLINSHYDDLYRIPMAELYRWITRMGAALRHGWNIWMITTLTWAVWAMCSTSASLPRSWSVTVQTSTRDPDTGRAGRMGTWRQGLPCHPVL